MNRPVVPSSPHPPVASVPPEHRTIPTGWRRCLFATSHKDIGTLDLPYSLTMLVNSIATLLNVRASALSS